MKDLFNALDTWNATDRPAAIARVVDLDGSGPRLPGAAMAVTADQDVRGSVSGGCVEGAVVIEALDVIEADAHRVVSFGYSDDEAFAVGLTCGGTIHLFLERFEPGEWYTPLKADIAAERAVALATVIDGPGAGNKLLVRADDTVIGTLGTEGLDRVVERDARGELAAGRSGLRHYGEHGEAREDVVSVFVAPHSGEDRHDGALVPAIFPTATSCRSSPARRTTPSTSCPTPCWRRNSLPEARPPAFPSSESR